MSCWVGDWPVGIPSLRLVSHLTTFALTLIDVSGSSRDSRVWRRSFPDLA